MRFDIITIFPHIFDSYLNESILGRAQKQGLIEIKMHDLRDYTTDKHHPPIRRVDDSPYGGGPGMVMMVEPIYRALQTLKNPPLPEGGLGGRERSGKVQLNKIISSLKPSPNPSLEGRGTRIILLTPRGQRFTQAKAKELAQYSRLILITGRYEGVDERVAEFVDEQISIGDYVLPGGELPAMVIVEAVSRLLPGVLGKDESSQEESWSDSDSAEYPHYTRPEVFIVDDDPASSAGKKELKVPEILLSGNHTEIAKWRKGQRK